MSKYKYRTFERFWQYCLNRWKGTKMETEPGIYLKKENMKAMFEMIFLNARQRTKEKNDN